MNMDTRDKVVEPLGDIANPLDDHQEFVGSMNIINKVGCFANHLVLENDYKGKQVWFELVLMAHIFFKFKVHLWPSCHGWRYHGLQGDPC